MFRSSAARSSTRAGVAPWDDVRATARRRRSAPSSSSTRRAGMMPNARILRYRLLRSTPNISAVRDMFPCCARERAQNARSRTRLSRRVTAPSTSAGQVIAMPVPTLVHLARGTGGRATRRGRPNHDHQPFDHISQFAHIAGPQIALQCANGVRLERLWAPAVFPGQHRHEVLGQQRHILDALRSGTKIGTTLSRSKSSGTGRRGSQWANPCWWRPRLGRQRESCWNRPPLPSPVPALAALLPGFSDSCRRFRREKSCRRAARICRADRRRLR